MIEREAKLFEAGAYPDKDVEITETDLDRIVAGFAEAPVKVEHEDTPFDGVLGALKRIWRRGRELFGSIAFTREAWGLIDLAGARRLSIAISPDKSTITEVSLVRRPRVAGAVVFSTGEVDGEPVKGGNCMNQNTESRLEACTTTKSTTSEEMARLEARNAELEFKLRTRDAQAKVDSLKRAGKLVPAAESFATAILAAGGSAAITFGDETVSAAQLFERFTEAMPKVTEFGERSEAGGPATEFSAAERAVFAKLGVSEEKAAQIIGGNTADVIR